MPNDYDELGSHFGNSLMIVGITLFLAMSVAMTMIIVYKLWYVAMAGFTRPSGST